MPVVVEERTRTGAVLLVTVATATAVVVETVETAALLAAVAWFVQVASLFWEVRSANGT
jgi:hypothetical protein